MHISRIKLSKKLFDDLVDFIELNIDYSYKYVSKDTLILAGEEYRFRTNSEQLYMLVIKHDEDALLIDLVCGGGGQGLIGLSLGSEMAFIKKAKRLLREFCEQNGETMEELEAPPAN